MKEVARTDKFLKTCEGTVVKISALSEHFPILVLKGLKILSVIINFGFLNLCLDIWIRIPNADPDPGLLNADQTGSGTLHKRTSLHTVYMGTSGLIILCGGTNN